MTKHCTQGGNLYQIKENQSRREEEATRKYQITINMYVIKTCLTVTWTEDEKVISMEQFLTMLLLHNFRC